MHHLSQYFKLHFVERSYESHQYEIHLWLLFLPLGALSGLGWMGNSMPIKAEKGRYESQNLLMPADTDTVKVFFQDLDFEMPGGNVGFIEGCSCFDNPYESKKAWILDPYIPEPMNLDKVLAQVAYPQELKVCEHISLKILIDRDGQYIRHKAIKGDSLVIATLEPYLSQLKFLPNPLGFDASPRWVELAFRLPFTARTSLSDINTFLYCDSEPKVLNISVAINKHPFPLILEDAGIEGSTMIRVLVSEEGDYLDHQVILSVHPILAKYWSQVVKELVFSPAQHQGKNIAFWVNIPFNYRLLY
ncbi:MAG: energy transducer TonB [Bacteroidota bacterium]